MLATIFAILFGIYSFTSSVDFEDRTHFDCPEIKSGNEDVFFYNQNRIAQMLEYCAFDETRTSRIS